MAELSPVAQAVWNAAWVNTPVQCGDIEGTRRAQVAAALRAAADQLAQVPIVINEPLRENIAKDAVVVHVADLFAIATELENQ